MTELSSVQILERLIAFPTVSRDTNLPLIDWVRNFLSDHGVVSHLIPNAAGTKANLIATIGPLEEEGLVLSGHTDVVPVDRQSWSSGACAVSPGGTDVIGVPFGTEAGQFQQAGWSTVVCGPGNIEQAHKPDEFVDISQLAECEVFLDRAVARQCGSNGVRPNI